MGGLRLLDGGDGDRGTYGTWYDWLCAHPEEWPSCPECGEPDVSLVPMPYVNSLSNAGVVGELIDNNAVNILLLIIGRQLWFHFRLNEARWARLSPKATAAWEPVALAVLVVVCVYMRGPGSAFIYFQF